MRAPFRVASGAVGVELRLLTRGCWSAPRPGSSAPSCRCTGKERSSSRPPHVDFLLSSTHDRLAYRSTALPATAVLPSNTKPGHSSARNPARSKMKRPSCRANSNPAWVSSLRWNESVAGAISNLAAMSPTQRPSGPFCTSSRKWRGAHPGREPRGWRPPVFDSIFLVSSNYKRSVKLPLSAGHGRIKIAPSNGGMTMKRIATWLAVLMASLAAGAAGAQPYPSKPVKIVVGFARARLRFHRAGHRAEADRAPGRAGDRGEPPRGGSVLGSEYAIKSPATATRCSSPPRATPSIRA